MKILFVADARSPIALNWIRHFAERGDDVYIASTFDCEVDFPIKRLDFTPVAFSALKKRTQRPGGASARSLSLRTVTRQWIGPLTIPAAARKLRDLIDEIQPDIIHAMRVPYEGMIATTALDGRVAPHDLRGAYRDHTTTSRPPLVISTWGNDFTLHARSTPLMAYFTRQAMRHADAIHSDCHRDVRLAHEWGLASSKPSLVAPGNGGIHTDIFHPPVTPVEKPIILNPRGFRPYVRNDTFFKAIPLVLAKHPHAKFICTGMAGEEEAIRRSREFGIETSVELLGLIPRTAMPEIYRRAQIVISPAIHDGTPNTLLEAMSCGCFPLAGDLESIREWITPNENGLLFDPTNPQAIAESIIHAIENKPLRMSAFELNQQIISTRAEFSSSMHKAEEFYKSLVLRDTSRVTT